jgi:hypothetical protein
MQIPSEDIERALIAEFGYPEHGAKLVVSKLQSACSEVRDAFDLWWRERIVPDIAFRGYTLRDLIEQHEMNVIAGFLTLDWLARDPKAAMDALSQPSDDIR